jgi:hypothetical protein
MFLDEEQPILDYLKRSPEEQNRLFKEGKSKCDGYEKVSRHQSGKAADIYFLNEDCSGLADPIRGWEYWHNYWEKLGGRPMIIWDKGHFEG